MKLLYNYYYNYIYYSFTNIYITLTSKNLFPSLLNSISIRVIKIKNYLQLLGLAPYSRNSCVFI